jgi:ABC-type Mn2+/Zn2+ transport system ATPase subunit
VSAPAPEVVVAARGLELGYGREAVLRGVDFEVRSGQAWFLLGANGSGKTTFVRAVLGLLRPRAGTLERHPQRAAPERLGFVPQVTAINPSLATTVREFVSLGLVGAGTPRASRAERIAWALARVGLERLAGADYWSLSGGQRRRALVARGLVRRPSWLVLDEPTEGLDAGTESLLLATLAELHAEEEVTLFFVTHRLSIAARHATHVALFHDGRVETGPRDVVLASEAARRIFGAEAAPE